MSKVNVFFIYIAKNEEWRQRQEQDMGYVHSMARFYQWWLKHQFNMNLKVECDILPVIPGKIFDRMSIGYLMRDHNQRGKGIYHFYLSYSKPIWTDCPIEGYTAENFGLMLWKRPASSLSDELRVKFYADSNCAAVSHLISHEILRMKGKAKREYFGEVHRVWNDHLHRHLPFIYFNDSYRVVSKESLYRFVTLDIRQVHSQ